MHTSQKVGKARGCAEVVASAGHLTCSSSCLITSGRVATPTSAYLLLRFLLPLLRASRGAVVTARCCTILVLLRLIIVLLFSRFRLLDFRVLHRLGRLSADRSLSSGSLSGADGESKVTATVRPVSPKNSAKATQTLSESSFSGDA